MYIIKEVFKRYKSFTTIPTIKPIDLVITINSPNNKDYLSSTAERGFVRKVKPYISTWTDS